ncbi:MAG: SGNH/GDSL hydrolase family protein [Bacteroidota bacterium]
MSNRRSFLKQSAIGAAALPTLSFTNAKYTQETADVPEKLTVLFQGDSITDARRDRKAYYANQAHGFGNGYALYAAIQLSGQHPTTDWTFYNRGISGHKVPQLDARWREDVLQLQPDVLSILIGVNDYWHTLNWDYKGTANSYRDDYRKLLERTKKALPNVKLLIAEPFYLAEGTAIDAPKWKSDFPAYQEVAKGIAKEFDAVFIPFQSVFDEALKTAPTSYWAADGVHPSFAGSYLMATAWLEGFDKLYR